MVSTPCPRLQGMGLPQSGQKLSGIQLAMLICTNTRGRKRACFPGCPQEILSNQEGEWGVGGLSGARIPLKSAEGGQLFGDGV